MWPLLATNKLVAEDRMAYAEALVTPAFAAGVSPLPGADALLVALAGAVCPEELPEAGLMGATCCYMTALVKACVMLRSHRSLS